MKFRFAFVLLPIGPFGGAQRRFTNLFRYLFEKYPNNVYYFVSYDLFEKIKNIFPDYPLKNVIPIGKKKFFSNGIKTYENSSNNVSGKNLPEDITSLRKFYRFIKSAKMQFALHRELEHYRKAFKIEIYLGVYSGILPFYFNLNRNDKNVKIIFSDMDSWFDEIYTDKKKYWYKKYSSFNYGLENADAVDFLSPFILNGVLDRGIKIPQNKIFITPCSFTDYKVCRIGDKRKIQIVFSARLEEDKNPLIFISAAKVLSKKYPGVKFHILGEGRLGKKVTEEIKGFKDIIFKGFHHSPIDILMESSIFISIQSTNNYPSQSVLEAMACGNAIIATDVGDTRMFINESNGYLIKLDLQELISTLEYCILNREQVLEKGKFAAEFVRTHHTIEKTADYYLNLFDNVHKNSK